MPENLITGLDASTRYCAVYGHPVRHSASPAMQNAGFEKLRLNCRYLAFDVHPEHLRAALEGARRMNFLGLNLTVPHKLLALDMMDVLDASASTWGAVNTVLFEGRTAHGDWCPLREFTDVPPETRARGFNTDADAITRSIREDLGIPVEGATVLLLGAGGAGRTAALKLASENVGQLYLVNRTPDKAAGIAKEIEKRFPQVKTEIGYPPCRVDLVLNATSLGLNSDDALPLDEMAFPLTRTGAAYDMIYRPAETRFLRSARDAGCRIANGLGMLLYQGARALEIWTGQTAPVEIMRRALQANIYV